MSEGSEKYAPFFDLLGGVWERIFGDEECGLLLSPFSLMAGMVHLRREVEDFGQAEAEMVKVLSGEQKKSP